jgi:uncharacterized protein with HEPN domain
VPTPRERCDHICTAIDAIFVQLNGRSEQMFLTDEPLRCACYYRLIVIGAAADVLLKVLPGALLARLPNLSGSLSYSHRLRTSLALDYHQIDAQIVWNTIQKELRPLQTAVAAVRLKLP